MLRRLRRAFVLEQNLLSGILQSSLVLPLIASDDNDNDGDKDIQGVPSPKTLFHQFRCNFPTDARLLFAFVLKRKLGTPKLSFT